MRIASILGGALCLMVASVNGAETAYQALRVLGTERGEDALTRVVEVRGNAGVPQPEVWSVTVEDPAARGGVRVFEVRSGRVISEHTPVTPTAGEPVIMDFNRLNMDSSGAFAVVEQEAVNARVGFDSVDYLLQASPQGPIWVLDLRDESGRPVGRAEVRSDTGAIVSMRSLKSGPAFVDREQEEYDRERDDRYYEQEGEPIWDRMKRFGKRIERHFRRDAAHVEKFFTGRRTLDRED